MHTAGLIWDIEVKFDVEKKKKKRRALSYTHLSMNLPKWKPQENPGPWGPLLRLKDAVMEPGLLPVNNNI